MSYIFDIQNLSKSFGSKVILQDLNLKIKQGESLVIMGGSGSGKSVLLKCILGLLTPEKGRITFAGQDYSNSLLEEESFVKKFSMLFQGNALFDSITVWENICFAILERGIKNKKEAKELAISKLKSVNLAAEVADLYPAELSGGMQRRVALARAIVVEPEIIFFDEPTAGLDPISATAIIRLIKSLRGNATTVTITHDLHSIEVLGDKIAMIDKGSIIWEGSRDNLYKSKNKMVEEFVNSYKNVNDNV